MFKKLGLILIAILGFQFELHANPELPLKMQKLLSSKVDMGECQSEWINNTAEYKTVSTDLNQNELLAIPCARWAHNLRWLVFLKISSTDNSKEAFFKPLYFSHYHEVNGFVARDYVENFVWDEKAQSIISRQYMNGLSYCGEVVEYSYHSMLQEFKIKNLIVNSDCSKPDREWLTIIQDSKIKD